MTLPEPQTLEEAICSEPSHPLTAARAELLVAMRQNGLAGGRCAVVHPRKQASVLAAAFRHDVPITVHPGIGYDFIATHPMFNGAVIGRAAHRDFAQLGLLVPSNHMGRLEDCFSVVAHVLAYAFIEVK